MLEKEIPRFDQQIADEQEEQKEKTLNIVKQAMSNLAEIEETMEKIIDHQKQYEQSVFEMFQDVVERAQKELQDDKQERIYNHKNMFMLIENAYEKINIIK